MEIWKYPLPPPACLLSMPMGAQLLSVHEQNGQPTLWVLVDIDGPTVTRNIAVVGTGWRIDKLAHGRDAHSMRALYVGTCFVGSLVWHVFDMGESP